MSNIPEPAVTMISLCQHTKLSSVTAHFHVIIDHWSWQQLVISGLLSSTHKQAAETGDSDPESL